jgi:hypothetical protein
VRPDPGQNGGVPEPSETLCASGCSQKIRFARLRSNRIEGFDWPLEDVPENLRQRYRQMKAIGPRGFYRFAPFHLTATCISL